MASPAPELHHLLATGQVWLPSARGAVGLRGVTDSGVTDSGITDSGITDSGITDSGITDSGITDSRGTGGAAAWTFAEVAGRLVELGGEGASAAWTAATALVLDAQRLGEPVAWVTRPQSTFYPPDVAGGGVDLGGLAVVRVPDSNAVQRAADCLLRSGAFGLVVLDAGEAMELPLPVQVRLAGLAKKHDAALVCLLESLGARGSFASLRAVSTRQRVGEGRFACALHMVKDKRRGQEWECAQVLRGPLGLR